MNILERDWEYLHWSLRKFVWGICVANRAMSENKDQFNTEQTAGSYPEPPGSLTWSAWRLTFWLWTQSSKGWLWARKNRQPGSHWGTEPREWKMGNFEKHNSALLWYWTEDCLMHSDAYSCRSLLLTLVLGRTQVSHHVHHRPTTASNPAQTLEAHWPPRLPGQHDTHIHLLGNRRRGAEDCRVPF